MPFLAVAIMWVWERLRPGKEGPIKLGGLFFACFLAVLSHPLLDLLNTYGTRVLEPFSNRWFYGDTLVHHGSVDLDHADPWPRNVVARRAARQATGDGRRPGRSRAMLLYIGLNAAISARAVALTRPLVERVARAADDRRRRGPARRSGSAR